MAKKYAAAVDQGTTGTRFMIFDKKGQPVSAAYEEHEQIYPQPGWVEHDPMGIWEKTQKVIKAALASAEDREDVEVDLNRLYIASAWVDEGPDLPGFRYVPGPRGRYMPIRVILLVCVGAPSKAVRRNLGAPSPVATAFSNMFHVAHTDRNFCATPGR